MLNKEQVDALKGGDVLYRARHHGFGDQFEYVILSFTVSRVTPKLIYSLTHGWATDFGSQIRKENLVGGVFSLTELESAQTALAEIEKSIDSSIARIARLQIIRNDTKTLIKKMEDQSG